MHSAFWLLPLPACSFFSLSHLHQHPKSLSCLFVVWPSEFTQGLGLSLVGSPGSLLCFCWTFSFLGAELFGLLVYFGCEALIRNVLYKYSPIIPVVSLPLLPLLGRGSPAASSLSVDSCFHCLCFQGQVGSFAQASYGTSLFSSSSFTVWGLHLGISSILS